MNCGAELIPDARFCRRCGQPSNPLERASVTEVTTRRLETPGQPFMPVAGVEGGQALDQTSGRTRAVVAGAETNALASQSAPATGFKRWLPSILILFIAILLPTFYLLRQWRQPYNIPQRPPAPPAIQQPPRPAAPQSQGASIDPRFIYPNARTTMVISEAGKGDMMRLETDDAMDKVADWYTDRLKPTEIVRHPGNVIFKAGDMSVIMADTGKGTSIMLKQGED